MRLLNQFHFRFAIVMLLLATMALPLLAQSDISVGAVPYKIPQVRRVGEGSKYYLNDSNELLIRVNIWGRVERPGQYYVPAETDLISLMSLAGGPTSRSRLSNVRVVREEDTGEQDVLTVNVRKYIKTGEKRLIPDLKPEDTVVVHGSGWQLVADVAQVIGQFAIVANVYYLFFIAQR
ncbi:MAG: SLBB domain-containing protein [Calditrichaeota bacterium]|nr:SLBB domain-containing protein [Calditrichota bacterium]MCB9365712.1 SLBB domain-containing protein [Calditrichota bacterium]